MSVSPVLEQPAGDFEVDFAVRSFWERAKESAQSTRPGLQLKIKGKEAAVEQLIAEGGSVHPGNSKMRKLQGCGGPPATTRGQGWRGWPCHRSQTADDQPKASASAQIPSPAREHTLQPLRRNWPSEQHVPRFSETSAGRCFTYSSWHTRLARPRETTPSDSRTLEVHMG